MLLSLSESFWAALFVKNVTNYRLHSVLAETLGIDYYKYGDGTKTPPNAPHCLLLWRKLPPNLRSSAEAFLIVELFRKSSVGQACRVAP